MNGYEVTARKGKVIVSMDTSLMDKEYIVRMLDRVRLEYLAEKAGFDDAVTDLSDDLKKNWWRENKESFLQ